MKPGRNAPCPCGSGKKYKRCCGSVERAPQPARSFDTAAAIGLANAHQFAGRHSAAEASFAQVLRAEPGNTLALQGLGWLAHLRGDDERAATLLRRALELTPSDWSMHYSLGRILSASSMLSEAAANLQRAISLHPTYVPIHNALGIVLAAQGKAHEVSACFERAMTLDPSHAVAFSNYVHSLHYLPELDSAGVFARHMDFMRRFARPLMPLEPGRLQRPPGSRIRLGYVSGDFRDYAVAWFIEPVLAHHDRGAYEIFCYSNHAAIDSVTRRLQSHAEHWRAIAAMTDDEVARRVRHDGIDILVDLSGHTRYNRLTMFALKPAPVQATWLGYFNTTGLPTVDYLISDPVSSPPGDAQPFSETLMRLPQVRLCYQPASYAPAVASLPAQLTGCVTFGTFNKLAKLNDAVIALWAGILHAVPGSRLLLKSHAFRDDGTRERYRELFAAHGIGAERLLLRPNSPHAEMLGEYRDIDIALDPFPYTGGLTTCEALWQGVPVLALYGDSLVSRQSSSFLAAIGLSDWIARTQSEYAAKAVHFAKDVRALAELRVTLRQRMARSPVCDATAFTRDLEGLYRAMWNKGRTDTVS